MEKYNSIPFNIWHSKTAVFYAQEKFSIANKDVLQAVSYHTTGYKKMNLLSRIIYASDYLASSYINNIEDLKKKNINEICLIKTNVTISFLKKQKKPIFKDTLNFLNWIKNQ